jgi:RNA-directed DNA polymerase
MNGKRRKTRCSVALEPAGEGEALSGCVPRAEPFAANPASESPAFVEQLMEEVCNRENLEIAWKRVRRNKGSPGVDGMTIDAAKDYLPEQWPNIRPRLLDGTYQPLPVKRVEIPKPDGCASRLRDRCP